MQNIVDWFKRQFNNPQIIILSVFLIGGFALIIFAGAIMAPVITALVIAYILEGGVKRFEKIGIPRLGGVLIILLLFLLLLLSALFGVLPLVTRQAVQIASQIPYWLTDAQSALLSLPARYPELLSEQQIQDVLRTITGFIAEFGQQTFINWSSSSVVGIINVVIYMIIVPILVFFFLKDKQKVLAWCQTFFPRQDHGLTMQVWQDLDRQMSNYIRGKFWEILIVGSVTFVVFSIFGLQYSALLSLVVGLSVLIPYVGAALVTIPVVIVAAVQWGLSPEFFYLIAAYLIIQLLDGNVLVPLIFSEVVNLHPIAIVVAVLFFGGLWGVWGIFFAIPLATLVQAIHLAWPRRNHDESAPL